MKIKVSSISEEGRRFLRAYAPWELDLETSQVRFLDNLEADYRINREGRSLFVRVRLKSRIETICARCLDRLEYPLDKEYSLYYEVKDTDIIDTTDELRQEIILDYPLKPLCRIDCLGLCPGCGENLNKGKCNCQMKSSLKER